MQCKEIKDETLGERYYEYHMENGLTVLVCPKPEKSGCFAMLGARIGSATGDFLLGGQRVTVPAGVAHFLEHKLFESEQGDAFTLFAKTGANANAYTSYDRTCYLFGASVNVLDSLAILVDFVSHPHFTAATVQKEQGIIGQEIKMYDDSAEWVLYTSVLRSLYKELPLREDIAGTVETIAQITPQTLYDCYDAFYRPANMVLSVCGNVRPEEVAAVCEKGYAGVSFGTKPVERLSYDEPDAIADGGSTRRMSIFEKQFCLGFKEIPYAGPDKLRRELAGKITLDLIAGETSPLYRELYDRGLINDTFELSDLADDDYLCYTFSGESRDPSYIADRIKAEIDRVRRAGVDRERFEEMKRTALGSVVCGFDSVETVATNLLYYHFRGGALFDAVAAARAVTAEDCDTLLQSVLRADKCALAVAQPQ
ncbi:MAG: pitrilysin family protein [Oscillospiraceae bacterium]|nr:pitrilysin family protein [Oscillospiraceae bacterium]